MLAPPILAPMLLAQISAVVAISVSRPNTTSVGQPMSWNPSSSA